MKPKIIFLILFIISFTAYADDSYRLSLEFSSSRRFATRFLEQNRMLQLKVVPARSQEFQSTQYYDSEYIERVFIEENNGEVVLNLQLKNKPITWTVFSKEQPWRIVIDFSKAIQHSTENQKEWDWQKSGVTSSIAAKPENITTAFSGVPQLPQSFGRFEATLKSDLSALNQLEHKANKALGPDEVFEAKSNLAVAFYKYGDVVKASNVFLSLSSLYSEKFRSNPQLLWIAGESAYLVKNFELAKDYFQHLSLKFNENPLSWGAQLRLIDIDVVSEIEKNKNVLFKETWETAYKKIAQSEKSPLNVKNIAIHRLLIDIVETNITYANQYQQNLNACVNQQIVSFEIRKKCAYIVSRYSMDKNDLLSAYRDFVSYKNFSDSDDVRLKLLEQDLQKKLKTELLESQKSNKWDTWKIIENEAPLGLLKVTMDDVNTIKARADFWQQQKSLKKVAQLYGAMAQVAHDDILKIEGAALAAKFYQLVGDKSQSSKYLNQLKMNKKRLELGMNSESIAAVRTVALSPYKNKIAVKLLIEEMEQNRFEEKELKAILELSSECGIRAECDRVFDSLIKVQTKDEKENKKVETALFNYAQRLSLTPRDERCADVYLAIAQSNKSKRRSEAAYKAGVYYGRARKPDKAKSAWQLGASGLDDKNYSSLSSERLQRMQ